jgi:hypothetical protein
MARKKLRWQIFVELNQAVLDDLNPAPDWHGLRVVAGDGTTLFAHHTPRHPQQRPRRIQPASTAALASSR